MSLANPSHLCSAIRVGLLSALLGLGATAWGQKTEIPPGNTLIEVEIVTPRAGGDILAAQRWGQLFDKLGIGVRVHSPLAGDKPEISEEIRGTFRLVKLVGVLDRNGRVAFPGHAYTLDEVDKLSEWIDELKVYGAQGSPAGQPLWGLSQEQFESLFKSLSQPVERFESSGRILDDVNQLPLPKDLPVRLHSSVEHDLLNPVSAAGKLDVRGISAGTALAAVLSQFGLGFRPLRTPSGAIELVVQPLKDIGDPWPIGWDIDPKATPGHVVPSLFEIQPLLGLQAQSLDSALKEASAAAKLPIVVDYRRCLEANIDVTTTQVSSPARRTAWGVIVGTILRRALLKYTIRNDETGQAFLYVHPFERTTIKKE